MQPGRRLLWARLSVFAGGFELDAAEGICADHRLPAEQVLDLLAALAGKSILTADHREGVALYRLPETLREYGQERLHESGEYTALRRRHRDWHEQLARRADTDWLSPRLAEWTARLFREQANVQAAQDFCQAEPGEAEAGLRIALHVWLFYYWSAGHVSEGRVRLAGCWPGRASPPCGGPGGCWWPVSCLVSAATAAPYNRCWSRAPAWPGSWTTRLRGRSPPGSREWSACKPVTCTRPPPSSKSGWRPSGCRRRPPAPPPADRPGPRRGPGR